jgi:hypothetical protein
MAHLYEALPVLESHAVRQLVSDGRELGYISQRGGQYYLTSPGRQALCVHGKTCAPPQDDGTRKTKQGASSPLSFATCSAHVFLKIYSMLNSADSFSHRPVNHQFNESLSSQTWLAMIQHLTIPATTWGSSKTRATLQRTVLPHCTRLGQLTLHLGPRNPTAVLCASLPHLAKACQATLRSLVVHVDFAATTSQSLTDRAARMICHAAPHLHHLSFLPAANPYGYQMMTGWSVAVLLDGLKCLQSLTLQCTHIGSFNQYFPTPGKSCRRVQPTITRLRLVHCWAAGIRTPHFDRLESLELTSTCLWLFPGDGDHLPSLGLVRLVQPAAHSDRLAVSWTGVMSDRLVQKEEQQVLNGLGEAERQCTITLTRRRG